MECAGRHLRGSCAGPATVRCGSCGAVRYCSRHHQKSHWSEHAQSCARMAQQMQRAPQLYDFPFAFSDQTTRLLEAGETSYCSLLESWGLHGAGVWKASCACFMLNALPGAALQENARWNLPASLCPCKAPKRAPPAQLQSWEEYYEWRGISFDSPVALILHWPLSLYHAISMSLSLVLNPNSPRSQKPHLQVQNPNSRRSLRVHYLGPEGELDQLPAFGELLALLPLVGETYIDFVGPAVPELRDGESFEFSFLVCCSDAHCVCKNRDDAIPKARITMKLWRGFYHARYPEMEASPPDLIFAANAGIAAFPSWHPTIRLIESLNVPAMFTDYCEEAAVMAAQTIQYVLQGNDCALAFPVEVNPFRQPLSSVNNDLNLPSFSNAFIFGIEGPSDAA